MKLFVLLFFFLLTNVSYAALESTSTVTINISNLSNSTLYFNGTSNFNPTNTISPSNFTLSPGKSIQLTGTTSTSNDLAGNVHFLDEQGKDNIFTILDYRQFHVGQPIFAMNNVTIASELLATTLNTDSNPRSLGYSAASVALDPAS